jgi:hypothetical protein
MGPILLVLAVTVTALIGWGIANMISDRTRLFSFKEKLALSYGLGMGAITLEMLIFHIFGVPFGRMDILMLPLAALAVSAIFFGRNTLPAPKRSEPLSFLEKVLAAGISLEVLLAFLRASLKPLESFDSVAMYAIRSKIIYLNGMIPHNFFSEITLNYPNPDYPLLVPLAEAWIYTFLGSLNDLLVKMIFPMYFVSFLAVFYFILRRYVSRRNSLVFTFLLATIPQFNRFAALGYTDLVFAYYHSIGTLYLFVWMKENRTRMLGLAAIFTGLAVFTKNEGIALCLVNLSLLVIYALFSPRGEKARLARYASIYFLIVLIVSGPWLALRAANGLENDLLEFGAMSARSVAGSFANPDRIMLILYEYQKQFFGPKKWNIVWILFLAGLFLRFKRAFSGQLRYITLSILMALSAYGAVYMLIPAPDPINWYVASGVSRLFIHFVALAVFWLAIFCRDGRMMEER